MAGGGVYTFSGTVAVASTATVNYASPATSGSISYQPVPDFATNISAGPADEAGQLLNFIVTFDHPELFAPGGAPAISPTGVLSYTPAPTGSDPSTVTVKLHDNGGNANGGNDMSAPQTFKLAVRIRSPSSPRRRTS